MKTSKFIASIIAIALVSACAVTDTGLSEDAAALSFVKQGGQGDKPGEAGVITAGEWNDLDNWDFWNNLFNEKDYEDKPAYWEFFTSNRISVLVHDGNDNALANVKVELKKEDNLIWTSKTDNHGTAEVWVDLFQEFGNVDINEYQLFIDNELYSGTLKFVEDGTTEAIMPHIPQAQKLAEISFIVDATGSMGDELEFLKKDLQSVINSVSSSNSNVSISTSSVFYRDEGDDYVTKSSDFTNDINTTLGFIRQQSADGGGDFPEAVHSALSRGIRDLQWSESATTKIAFLLLDAPPHYDAQVIDDIQSSIELASKKGIKIIPITASGIDKETEFLMRFISVATNGTYVFITDDSGVGNDHLEPTVGEYEVELLNELMVRLINKYLD